jgi:ACS family glucarate transporter-like MFS transporter
LAVPSTWRPCRGSCGRNPATPSYRHENSISLEYRLSVKYRHRVLALLATLSVITYLDRVCISIAGPRIQNEFALTPEQWGLVTGAFAVAYALFEIPSGYWADKFGARAMLVRIVLWWSLFTTATGFVSRLWSLVVVRFLFGAGEAGAYPTAATVIFRWFPAVERGRSFGVVLLSGQLGAALAPLLIVPIQARFGWRASFYAFGLVGVCWSAAFWRWYRNTPQQKAGITARELAEIAAPVSPGAAPASTVHALPWRAIAANRSICALMGATFGYLYAYYFFLFWLPTYLIRERGFTENQTKLSALPFVLGMIANLAGGVARDRATRRWGPTWGPRSVGLIGLGSAAAAVLAALVSPSGYLALVWLALCYGGITFQQPTVFSTCVDIGKRYSGAVAGCINTAGALGGLLSSFIFGYLVQRFHSYDAVLVTMTVVLGAGAVLWLFIDATEELRTPGEPRMPGDLGA